MADLRGPFQPRGARGSGPGVARTCGRLPQPEGGRLSSRREDQEIRWKTVYLERKILFSSY